MQPKTISTLLLLIGVAGSILCQSCINEESRQTTILHYDYQNNTEHQIILTVYKNTEKYDFILEKKEVISQTVKIGAISRIPNDLVMHSDSISIVFSELAKILWYKGPLDTSTDKPETSPFYQKNYIRETEAKDTFKNFYFFTQKHVDLARPRQ